MACPAAMVWLEVAEVTEKSGITVSGNGKTWLGCPDVSATVKLMLYVAGAIVFGTLSVRVNVAGALALIATGLVGVIMHWPEIALASQLAVTDPA